MSDKPRVIITPVEETPEERDYRIRGQLLDRAESLIISYLGVRDAHPELGDILIVGGTRGLCASWLKDYNDLLGDD